jgi:anti-sigma B factor antagonist
VPEDLLSDGLPAGAGGPAAEAEVVVLPTEVDVANADMVLAALSAVLARGVRILVADMADTVFCDCTGAAALLAVHRQALDSSAQLRIVVGNGPVPRLFEITGLDQWLSVYTTTAAACEPSDRPPRAEPDA